MNKRQRKKRDLGTKCNFRVPIRLPDGRPGYLKFSGRMIRNPIKPRPLTFSFPYFGAEQNAELNRAIAAAPSRPVITEQS